MNYKLMQPGFRKITLGDALMFHVDNLYSNIVLQDLIVFNKIRTLKWKSKILHCPKV